MLFQTSESWVGSLVQVLSREFTLLDGGLVSWSLMDVGLHASGLGGCASEPPHHEGPDFVESFYLGSKGVMDQCVSLSMPKYLK